MALTTGDWIGIANTAIQTLAFIGLVVYVVKTAAIARANQVSAEASLKALKQLEETRLQETAPSVVVYFDIPYGETHIHLIVENVGRSPALNIRFEFTPPIASHLDTDGFKIADQPALAKGIPTLPPGYQLKFLFDHSIQRLGEENGLPLRYNVRVKYNRKDVDVEYDDLIVLDLEIFERIYSRKKDVGDLSSAIESSASTQKAALQKVSEAVLTLAKETVALRSRRGIGSATADDALKVALLHTRRVQHLLALASLETPTRLPAMPWETLRGRLVAVADDMLGAATVVENPVTQKMLAEFAQHLYVFSYDPLIRNHKERLKTTLDGLQREADALLAVLNGAPPDSASSG